MDQGAKLYYILPSYGIGLFLLLNRLETSFHAIFFMDVLSRRPVHFRVAINTMKKKEQYNGVKE